MLEGELHVGEYVLCSIWFKRNKNSYNKIITYMEGDFKRYEMNIASMCVG